MKTAPLIMDIKLTSAQQKQLDEQVRLYRKMMFPVMYGPNPTAAREALQQGVKVHEQLEKELVEHFASFSDSHWNAGRIHHCSGSNDNRTP